MKTHRIRWAAAVAAALLAAPASAIDLSWSGFGTVGWTRSDRSWTYERNVDDGGGFERDTVAGLQLDARLAERWSATLQIKAAQALDRDSAWDVTPAWAFVGWRPNDDWLLRVGRMRAPFYLYSEQRDVGATHDLARLPTEIYSTVPTNEFDGAAASRTWEFDDASELALDAYAGRATVSARTWFSVGLPPQLPAGASFVELHDRAWGAALTWRHRAGLLRAGAHRIRTTQDGGRPMPVRPVHVSGPGLDFYKTDNAIPIGPAVETTGTITNDILTLGVEQRFGGRWRVAAEYARNIQRDTELGSNTAGAYLALFGSFDSVTPYVAVSRLRSTDGSRQWHRRLTSEARAPIPAIAASQRIATESLLWTADQRSVAIGASWTPASGRKFKLEWQRTAIGQTSRFAETPVGGQPIHDTHVDVWSLNANFVF